jgi:hypothetical protein
MPTYINSNFIFSMGTVGQPPVVGAVYADPAGNQFTVVGAGVGANLGKYGVTGIKPPAIAPTIQFVSPQFPVSGTPQASPTGYNNATALLTLVSGVGAPTVTLTGYTYATVANVGFTRIEPGQSVSVVEQLINLPYWVAQTSAIPFVDPNIYSVILTSTTQVNVPKTVIDNSTGLAIPLLTNYKIRCYVGAGACTIQTNSSGAVGRQIGLYDFWEIHCNTRMVDNIIVTITSGTVYVTIEKL